MSSDLGQYLKMLQSSDPAQRRQAIIALGKSADKRALKPLGSVYKTDPDESLRQLALKAGRHIQKTTSAMDDDALAAIALPETGSLAITSDEVPEWMNQMGAAAQKPKKVTERDIKKGRILVERAFNAQIHGKSDKVIDYVAEAIEVNPDLARDGTLIGLLAQATGRDGIEAMNQLKRQTADDAKKGRKRKKSGMMDWSETIDFGVEMGIWIFVIFFIWAGILFSFIVTLSQADWEELKAEARTEGATEQELEVYDESEEFVDEYGDVAALIGGATISLSITSISVFMSLVTWFVGVSFMGGEGLLYPFLRMMMRTTTVVLLLVTLGLATWLFILPESDAGLYVAGGVLLLGTVITGWAIGRVQEFGMAMGCLNMLGTVIMCNVMWCGCNILSSF
jgi:hypothetical protein